MSMQVTPGYGTTVATQIKGSAHHQNVIAHADHVRSFVTPPVTAAPYSTGRVVGSEMTFNAVTRFAGDYAVVQEVQILLRGNSVQTDMDLVLYPSVLKTQPVNGAELTLTDSEALAVQAVIRIPGGAFLRVGSHKMATVQTSAVIQSPAGASSIRGVLVARGPLVPAAVDAVTASLSVRRD